MGRPKKIQVETNDDQTVYMEYVHGKSINTIAEERKVDVSEVLAEINAVEQKRGAPSEPESEESEE